MLGWLRTLRRQRHVSQLVRRGLRLGPGVFLNDGFFLDPSHCHLITIDEGAVFGPGVTLLAHDASTLPIIGKTKIQAVRVGKRSFVGARAILLPGAEVGDGSILGAGSVLNSRIPPGEVWAGNPARRIATVDAYRDKLSKIEGCAFSEADYQIDALTESTRAEMISEVTLDRAGFMIDDDLGSDQAVKVSASQSPSQ
jgi:maltose O-acetyltransferase